MIHVVEQFVEPKNRQIVCEDAIVTTENFCAVIDGATCKSSILYEGKTSGRLAAELIERAIKRLPRKISKIEAVKEITASIHNFYVRYNLIDEVKYKFEKRLTACVVIYSDFCKEVWLIGDCQCRFKNQTYYNIKIIDKILSGIRSDVLHYFLNKGYTIAELQQHDLGRESIFSALLEQTSFQNISRSICPFGYPVIDGFNVQKDDMRSFSVTDCNEVVLASDGYPILADTLKQSEVILQKLISEDPLCIGKNKSTKGILPEANSYDDRAFVKIQIS